MVLGFRPKHAFFLSACFAVLFLASPSPLSAKDNWIEVQTPNFTVVSNAGENEARRIADQFEQFREVFHNSLPNLRVDLGKRLIILAVKNEDSLKILLPGYWEVKGGVHPAGIFVPGEARHYVAVRTNIEADNPYEVIYHEYTHVIMNLNFEGLPIWLGEGIAEFFGNSTIHVKEVEIGKISPSHLMVLQGSRLIPIDSLILADAKSPYYNEQDRATVFYAESWAIVHYLLMDPDARKRQLLLKFLTTWDATGNQLQAAQQAFGDLKKFSSSMERYARQTSFYVGKVNTSIHGDLKSYATRNLSAAEVSAQEALFYLQMRRPKEAKTSMDAALAADPNVALAHEALGLLAYQEQDYAAAQKEFARSIELSPTSYVSYFYEAQSHLRTGITEHDQLPEINGYLENAIALNPQFAAAYATLANFYSMYPKTWDKALIMGKKAIELEPGNLNYATSYGYVLLNMGKVADAKTLAGRIEAAARTPEEEQMADEFTSLVGTREKTPQTRGVQARAPEQSTPTLGGKSIEVNPDRDAPPKPSTTTATSSPPPPTEPSRQVISGPDYRIEGRIAAAECPKSGDVKLTLSVYSVLMKFHATDLKTVEVTPGSKLGTPDKPPCAGWKGQKAKVTFHPDPPGEYDGELTAIYFF